MPRRWRGYSGTVSESAFIVLAPKKRTGAARQGGTPVRASVRRRRGTAKNAAIHNWTAVIRKYLNVQELARAAMMIINIGQLDIFQIDCNHRPIIYR